MVRSTFRSIVFLFVGNPKKVHSSGFESLVSLELVESFGFRPNCDTISAESKILCVRNKEDYFIRQPCDTAEI